MLEQVALTAKERKIRTNKALHECYLEGLKASPRTKELLEQYNSGKITIDEAIEISLKELTKIA